MVSKRELERWLEENPELSIAEEPPRADVQEAGPRLFDREYDLQAAVIAECEKMASVNPDYGLIYAIPNGQYRKGQRPEAGLKKGVLDLFWPVPRHGWNGLYIELKVKHNKPTADQLRWIAELFSKRYQVAVVWDSLDEVMRVMHLYWLGRLSSSRPYYSTGKGALCQS